jgi:murein DD-endopeptidase MepM/ murein hydrolase activator NlpD
VDIIFFAEDGRQRLQLSLPRVAALLSVVALGVAATFFVGAKYGMESVRVKPTGAVSLWTQDIALQQADVSSAIERSKLDLDALAMRLGQIQARADRLDALGKHLSADPRFADGEFDFGVPPPIGGNSPTQARSYKVSEFVQILEQLEARLADRVPKLEALSLALSNRDLIKRLRPRTRPVFGGWISSRFGYRSDPKSGERVFHRGTDFAARKGTKVFASADGVVTESQRRTGYGNTVQISHADGFVTRYAHHTENLVSVGDFVRQGQAIALVGATGRTTGTHLHYEVSKNGESVDPQKFFPASRRQ